MLDNITLFMKMGLLLILGFRYSASFLCRRVHDTANICAFFHHHTTEQKSITNLLEAVVAAVRRAPFRGAPVRLLRLRP